MTGEQRGLTDWQKGERMLKRLIRGIPQCEERRIITDTATFGTEWFRCVYEAGHTDMCFFLLDPEVNRG